MGGWVERRWLLKIVRCLRGLGSRVSSAPSVPDAVITVRTHVAACLTLVRFVDDASYRIGHSLPQTA